MDSSKIYAYLFLCMLLISSATPILGCGYCGNGKPPKKHQPKPKTPVVRPPVTVPPIVKPPVVIPPITVPPIVKPPITLPPIVKPPGILPPVLNPPYTPSPSPGNNKGTPCPPPKSPAQATCPIDTLKLGACVDLLGGLVHIGLGDPVANQCCPVLQGLVELEAAVCLCTTLKLKLLNLNIYVPLALQLLVACGKSPPPGYTCSL
uniref:36.4 kDa proline-rich protein n=1 Tax=Cajanus cajan TaxID=3821 RepID=A0A151RR39_CAJCA|nr:36.4 kDa proline-rich protein [Cajanus cajan]